MLFHVQMIMRVPHDLAAQYVDERKARERIIAEELQ
jgi:muconolactone delta-isomerase